MSDEIGRRNSVVVNDDGSVRVSCGLPWVPLNRPEFVDLLAKMIQTDYRLLESTRARAVIATDGPSSELFSYGTEDGEKITFGIGSVGLALTRKEFEKFVNSLEQFGYWLDDRFPVDRSGWFEACEE